MTTGFKKIVAPGAIVLCCSVSCGVQTPVSTGQPPGRSSSSAGEYSVLSADLNDGGYRWRGEGEKISDAAAAPYISVSSRVHAGVKVTTSVAWRGSMRPSPGSRRLEAVCLYQSGAAGATSQIVWITCIKAESERVITAFTDDGSGSLMFSSIVD
jgi:hypothetical protein